MQPFVTFAWLAAHLQDENLIVLDATMPPVGVTPPVDTAARYLEQHIPGAVFFSIDDISDHSSPYPHTLPSPEAFAASMSALGVSDKMDIVVYEQSGVFSAPRARWMLRTMGARNVFLLEGDFVAWIAAVLPTASGPVHRGPASFEAAFNKAAVKDFAAVQHLIAHHAQILDARSAGRFSGAAPEPRAGLPSGHMPGATSVPIAELITDGKMKDAEQLRNIFAEKGVDLKAPITTTCGSGVTAAVVALGLELAGATEVTLYDGSWSEYAQQPSAVIETSL
jgi:thiosulfate/3-mercaptopyruvate sulfurtransferase